MFDWNWIWYVKDSDGKNPDTVFYFLYKHFLLYLNFHPYLNLTAI